jgi:hypothetical protein
MATIRTFATLIALIAIAVCRTLAARQDTPHDRYLVTTSLVRTWQTLLRVLGCRGRLLPDGSNGSFASHDRTFLSASRSHPPTSVTHRQPASVIENPVFNTLAIVTLLSMPIARVSSGGLAHVIFSLPSRITIRGHISPSCRDAKLKMLCQMCSSTFHAVTPHAGICAGAAQAFGRRAVPIGARFTAAVAKQRILQL